MESDNNFDKREQNYLNDIAIALELSAEDKKQIILNPEKFKLVPPPEDKERMTILYYIMFAMRIDGKILPKEEDIIYDIGIKLGFRDMMLTDMISVMKNHLEKRLSPDILLSIIRKYLN